MFTPIPQSPPTLATNTGPASPTRPSRLRGLSYLRSYTQTHLHSHSRTNSRESTGSPPPPPSPRRQPLTRSTSYPTPASTPSVDLSTPSTQREIRVEDSPANGTTNTAASIGAWVPAVREQSTTSHTTTQPQTSSLVEEPIGLDPFPPPPSRNDTMGRTRSATTSRVPTTESPQSTPSSAPPMPPSTTDIAINQLPSIRFSQHQDIRAPRPSLVFTTMSRILPTGNEIIHVGRYSERENGPNTITAPNIPSSTPIGFKSKVVSRRHCEFWFEKGSWFIKDVKSSSGTFLNHVRLSSPGAESKPFPIKDGDIVQLGIDFKGGEEMIFRCVKIRVELNRGWQNSLNSFNVASHRRLLNLQKQNTAEGNSNAASTRDCTICLGPVAPCQSLFVAPCSHTWHYKCVRRIINGPSWPQFVCPNCRAVADLEADVDEILLEAEWEDAKGFEGLAAPAAQAKENESRTLTTTIPQLDPEEESGRSIIFPDPPLSRVATEADTTTESADTGNPQLVSAMNLLHLSETPTPSVAAAVESHSTVPPVEIRAGRNGSGASGNVETGASNRHERTPSPNSRLSPDHMQVLNGPDGPMTPRNDAGPFVFDGSAGQALSGVLA